MVRISQAEYDALVKGGHLPAPEKKPSRTGKYKSKAEAQYAWELEAMLKDGDISWWAYEPITLVVVDAGGKRCRYTPDFLLVRETEHGSELEFVEVKGFCREAARIRFLAARERYPFWTFTMVRKAKHGWETIL